MGRDEKRAPLNSPPWEARLGYAIKKLEKKNYVPAILISCVTLSYVICFSATIVKLSGRKDSLVVGSPKKHFDFNSLTSPFLGFRVIQTEYWPDFNLETVFYCCRSERA